MKTLIVYYSFTKNNKALAKMIQSRLDCDMLEIETVRKRSPFSMLLYSAFGLNPKIREHNLTLMDYDQFVFVAPIWAGKIAGPLKTFLRLEKGAISRYSFISICGGRDGQVEKIDNELASTLDVRPLEVCELGLSEIVGKGSTKEPTIVAAYRIGPSDLEMFNARISKFCEAVQGEPVRQTA